MIIIKKAQLKDLEDIRKLNQALFNNDFVFDKTLDTSWPERNIKYYKENIISKDKVTFIALLDNKIVGYLIASIQKGESYRTLKRIAELENMLVIEKFRCLGAGGLLVNEFFKWAKSMKVSRAKVVASAENEKAISFYKKNHFVQHDITLEADIA